MANGLAGKAQEVAKEDYDKARVLLNHAAKSGSYLYPIKLAVMAFVNGPLAVLTTALLILNESSTITGIISKNYLLQEAIMDTFDGTLMARNNSKVVAEGRELKARGDSIQRLGKALKKPFARFSVNELIRYVMYLPLNFIPGTASSAPDLAYPRRTLTLMTQSWVPSHSSFCEGDLVATPFMTGYTGFGAALWAADIEAKENEIAGSTAPDLREAAKRAE
ncbi:hypothetical protein CHGG_06559 [Chaetomium globosum CBS 148.51]|uniref:Uncharacterized protein n=1 Tax=Chaetomium globosum (strain ATCC 6205 / CBS 148.51 / DSM 1962 / NBRC 6347 / NRRL 1970) TaxID=306901 RepID=Q2H456_CHAGB|nr:uncharacterized protein CHGG_06559 [Chaetomium globosum CBS 148.51]EAQ89940.1 hypothetical protein CHGG_06559 [Chaetomium globosum CBS 148.51]